MNSKKKFFIFAFIALAIKFSLFAYAEISAPKAKFEIDTKIYLESGMNLVSYGKFAMRDSSGSFEYERLRTPGYPLFLGVLHGIMKIPFSGIVFIQIILTILAAFLTYKTASNIDHSFGYLSALIVLFDPPVTISSLMLLTETVFLLLISLFMYTFGLYLKERKIKFIILSALILVMATYVRPISYLLGLAIFLFIIYITIRLKTNKLLLHALIFILIIYSLLGVWHLRNYKISRINAFSTITFLSTSYKNSIRNDDVFTRSLPPVPYYLNAVSRCVMSLMTNPGTLKNFHSYQLRIIGKIVAYPWMVFWLIGFLFGITKIENNLYLQFLSFIVLYFICASVGGLLFGVSSRMRVPMVPFIAILSANGWVWLISSLRKKVKNHI